MTKRLTFHGPTHVLEVPGFFTLARGESADIDDDIAEALLIANPRLILSVTDSEPRTRRHGHKTQPSGGAEPEAHSGEGQPTTTDTEEGDDS